MNNINFLMLCRKLTIGGFSFAATFSIALYNNDLDD